MNIRDRFASLGESVTDGIWLKRGLWLLCRGPVPSPLPEAGNIPLSFRRVSVDVDEPERMFIENFVGLVHLLSWVLSGVLSASICTPSTGA